jgi:hypothetical protein
MRARRKIIIALGGAVGAGMVAAWVYHVELRAANASYISDLAARGEPLTLAEVRPPPVPAAENSADIYLKAVALLDADNSLLKTNICHTMLSVGPGKAVACSQLPEAVGYDFTNSWAEMSRALTQNQKALEFLQQVAEHPALDFHVHYERGMGNGFDFKGLNLMGLKESAEYLSTAITINLHDRDAVTAVKNQRAMLALVNALRHQKFVISELVGMAIMHIAQSACWEILQSPDATEPQLATLQNDWERVNYIQSWQDALAMERVTGEITLAQWRGSTSGLGHYLGLGKSAREAMGMDEESDTMLDKFQTDAKIFLWRFWWSYPDELRSLKGYQVLLGASRLVAANGCFQAAISNQLVGLDALQITKLPDNPIFSEKSDFHSMMSQSVVSLSGTTRATMMSETARQMTITAIALQRFKLAHSRYPASLAGLVPSFLAAVPPDPVDGQPLRYRLQGDGTFLLYSVGENGVDDGGNPSPADHGTPKTFYWQDRKALDWVWPQATTADDVQFIYPPAAAKY